MKMKNKSNCLCLVTGTNYILMKVNVQMQQNVWLIYFQLFLDNKSFKAWRLYQAVDARTYVVSRIGGILVS